MSIQYQTHRDLLGILRPDLQQRIATEGWGQRFLAARKREGHWGDRFYQPKWQSTHYTLLDLRHLCLPPDHPVPLKAIRQVLEGQQADDGGIQLGPSTAHRSDVCVNAMFLNYASYFRVPEAMLTSLVDVILQERMSDGGFNCRTVRSGARHSSLHTTISVLEGLHEFRYAGHTYREQDMAEAMDTAVEFILIHHLYLSDRTGEIIKKEFIRLPFPGRWKYDILRALDFFQYANIPWDDRMAEAMAVLHQKRNQDGTWNVQAAHPGQVHFVMEKAGRPSRWNTLRALRVLRHFKELD